MHDNAPPTIPIIIASHGLHKVQIAVIATSPPKIPHVNCDTFSFFLYFLFSLQLYTIANKPPPIDELIVLSAALDANFHFPD